MKHPCPYQAIDGEPIVKVLLDADVLLELFINRGGFVEDVERLLAEIDKSPKVEVYVTDKCLKRIRLEEELGERAALYVEKILRGRVIKISGSIRDEARTYCLRDFDSAEEVVCAKNEQLDAIVTLNPQNFDGTNNLLIWSVEDLFARLQLNKNWLIPYAEEKPVIVMLDACYTGKISLVNEFHTAILWEPKGFDIIHFSGHGAFTKLRERINFYWKPQIKLDDELDNWITSDEALLLFRNSYWLLKKNRSCKSRNLHTIYSSKYLHKDLLKVLLDKFPNKNVNNCYGLPFHYSPHQLQFSQHNRWIWCLKLSLTIALGIKPGYDPKIALRT
jgi:hypothetical protein